MSKTFGELKPEDPVWVSGPSGRLVRVMITGVENESLGRCQITFQEVPFLWARRQYRVLRESVEATTSEGLTIYTTLTQHALDRFHRYCDANLGELYTELFAAEDAGNQEKFEQLAKTILELEINYDEQKENLW